MKKQNTPVDTVPCAVCSTPTPHYHIVHYGSTDGGYRDLCTRCFNADVAARNRLDHFENIQFDKVMLADCTGQKHEFHFRTRLLGDIVTLEAFELHDGAPGGYEFQIIGKPRDELMSLLARLIERMRRSLSVKHLKQDKHGRGIADMTVRAKISSNYGQGEGEPMLVIDGHDVSWAEFGRMLLTFEGWQFRMQIADRSEEI